MTSQEVKLRGKIWQMYLKRETSPDDYVDLVLTRQRKIQNQLDIAKALLRRWTNTDPVKIENFGKLFRDSSNFVRAE